MNMTPAVCIVVFVLLARSITVVTSIPLKTMQFNNSTTFKIVQFTDLHYGDSENDKITAKVQATVLDLENPDLVVLTGDAVHGWLWNGEDGWFEQQWFNMIRPMEERKIKWAYVLGNHDGQADLSREEIMELDSGVSYSMSSQGPGDIQWASNYHIPLMSSTNPSEVAAVLYMLDTGDGEDCVGFYGWGCIYDNQIEWYKDTSKSYQTSYNHIIPSLAFMHQPPPQIIELWNNYPVKGTKNDDVTCTTDNDQFVEAVTSIGDVQGIFFGHDHSNDFIGNYNEKLILGYGRKSGKSVYGPCGLSRGARVIEITEEPFSIKSWIRDEKGRIDEQPSHSPDSNDQILECTPHDVVVWIQDHQLIISLSFVLLLLMCWGCASVCCFWRGRTKKYKQLNENEPLETELQESFTNGPLQSTTQNKHSIA